MIYKKRKRVTWKPIQRCVCFFTAVCVIPVLLVLFVASGQYMRPLRTSNAALIAQNGRLDASRQKISALTNKNMSVVEERLLKRKIFLRKMCSDLDLDTPGNDSVHRPNPWEFLIDRKHHLIWCNVFKAASTSWMYNFNLLAGYSPKFLKKTKQVPLTLARHKYPRPALKDLREALKSSLSFLIVRHPLERLLSAYTDKIQYSLPHTYHRKLGNEIIQKYRTKESLINDEKLRTQRYPSFTEFVSYVLDVSRDNEPMDMHWTPITEFCTPCLFDFDIIAHTETLQDDQDYLIHKAGLEKLIKPEWKNAGHGVTIRKIEQQYSQLTRAQILQLYHIYKYDFELFNYSLQGYLDIAKPDRDPADLLDAITLKKWGQKYYK